MCGNILFKNGHDLAVCFSNFLLTHEHTYSAGLLMLLTCSPAIETQADITSPTTARPSTPVEPKILKKTASQLSTCVRKNATFCSASSGEMKSGASTLSVGSPFLSRDDSATLDVTITFNAFKTAGRSSGWP
jgi:hypothetical protein